MIWRLAGVHKNLRLRTSSVRPQSQYQNQIFGTMRNLYSIEHQLLVSTVTRIYDTGIILRLVVYARTP